LETSSHFRQALVVEGTMIIGFTGYARSGKDTAAKALIGETLIDGGKWKSIGFADAVKEEVLKRHFGVRMLAEEWGWETAKDLFPFVRPILQYHGMKRRAEDPDYWIKKVMDVIDAESGNWVLTDVRFENEVKAIHQRGGIIVRIDRPGIKPANNHESETSIDRISCDYVIANDGTLNALAVKVGMILGVEMAHTPRFTVSNALRYGPRRLVPFRFSDLPESKFVPIEQND
jgi:hypothetical protein